MAVPPNTDAAFLREVDEELRRDELARAWRRYGIAGIVAIVLGILAFGGWQLWSAHQQTVSGEQGEILSKAYEDIAAARTDAARTKLDTLATSGVGGYRALAAMSEADLLLTKNDLRGAAAKFAKVAPTRRSASPFAIWRWCGRPARNSIR